MVWSFSSVNSYQTCPKGFYCNYILKYPKSNNAFAEWGSFGHSLFERYYKDEIDLFDIGMLYESEYETNVTLPFPRSRVDLGERYRAAGQEFFDHFEGLPDNLEIIGVEQKVTLTIGKYAFVGYIDLILRDKNDGKYIVYDHKSKSGFKDDKEKDEYLRQLYLYSLFIMDRFGVYPKELTFNMFRAGMIVTEAFDEEKLGDAINWFTGTIDKIYEDTKFYDHIYLDYKAAGKKLSDFKKQDFFCNNLCNVRTSCLRSIHYKRN